MIPDKDDYEEWLNEMLPEYPVRFLDTGLVLSFGGGSIVRALNKAAFDTMYNEHIATKVQGG